MRNGACVEWSLIWRTRAGTFTSLSPFTLSWSASAKQNRSTSGSLPQVGPGHLLWPLNAAQPHSLTASQLGCNFMISWEPKPPNQAVPNSRWTEVTRSQTCSFNMLSFTSNFYASTDNKYNMVFEINFNVFISGRQHDVLGYTYSKIVCF